MIVLSAIVLWTINGHSQKQRKYYLCISKCMFTEKGNKYIKIHWSGGKTVYVIAYVTACLTPPLNSW